MQASPGDPSSSLRNAAGDNQSRSLGGVEYGLSIEEVTPRSEDQFLREASRPYFCDEDADLSDVDILASLSGFKLLGIDLVSQSGKKAHWPASAGAFRPVQTVKCPFKVSWGPFLGGSCSPPKNRDSLTRILGEPAYIDPVGALYFQNLPLAPTTKLSSNSHR
jgi:hypothetical protein